MAANKEETIPEASGLPKNGKFVLRFIPVVLLLVLALALIGMRMVHLAVGGGEYRQRAASRVVQDRPIAPRTGNIYSSDGFLMASSVLKYNIRWDVTVPSSAVFEKNLPTVCEKFARWLPSRSRQGWEGYIRAARSSGNAYLNIVNETTQQTADSIRSLSIFKTGNLKGGLIVQSESFRMKPLKGLADRLLGLADDNRGHVGIEGKFANLIQGEPGIRAMQRIKGEWKPLSDLAKKDPVDGKDLVLTLNIGLQDAAHRILLENLVANDADHGTMIVMEVKTGAIRAMVNLGKIGEGKYAEIQNYAVGESNDPGSTFKLMSYLAALEDGVSDTSKVFDTEKGIYTIYGAHVRDYKAGGYGKLSMAKSFVKSSNTATVKMVYEPYKDNPERFINRLHRMNLASRTGIEIPGEPDPYIPDPNDKKRWSGISLPWVSYGYEVQLTPLQILAFYNAVANDGQYIKPTVVEKILDQGKEIYRLEPEKVTTVASFENVKKMQELMRRVVTDRDGTAHRLDSPHLRIAGKTGTAQYGYGRPGVKVQHNTSFAGYFPADDPKYSVMIVVYQPKGWNVSGGSIAAPLAKSLAQEIYVRTPQATSCHRKEIARYDQQVRKEYFENLPDMKKGRMPQSVGKYPCDVIPALEKEGVKVSLSGAGGRIRTQKPAPGAVLKKGDTVVLVTAAD